ncbi:MAG: InlB B-repeat-containing protein [Clostridia bacterium]|nr:InlB B-repeat-containing protein [Clostridia bacterium]
MKKILAVLVSVLAMAFVLIGCSEPKQHKITFVSDEKTVFSAVATAGSEILMPQVPIKDGYEFVGWESSGEIVAFPYIPTKDTTFNAVWACLHEWKQASTTSTCEETGVAFFTCTQCNKIKQEDAPALGHDFIDDIKEPTCKEAGYIKKLCSRCGHDGGITETIDKLLHTAVILEATAPTCEKTGLTAGVKCSVCDEILAKQETIPEYGHKSSAAVMENTVEATCALGGSYDSVIYCAVCDKELSREAKTVDKLLHTAVIIEAIAPTCEDTGLSVGMKCSECGEILVIQETIPAYGHKSSAAVKENVSNATCALGGSYDSVVYCAICDKELSREKMTVDALVHTEVNIIVENSVDATCTEVGMYENVVYCTVCNEELSREAITVDKLPHIPKLLNAVAPTCEKTGLTAGMKCSECDEILAKQEIIPAYGHKSSAAVMENTVEATCALGGSYDRVIYCAVCDKELSREAIIVDKLLHTAIIIEAIAPACENTGLTTGMKCSVCDEILVKQETIPALGHKWGEWVTLTEVSCTSDGERTRECYNCSEKETERVLSEGHNYLSYKLDPTCVVAGYRDLVCSLCGSGSGKHEFISALGHTYERDDFDGTTGTVIDEDEGIITYYCQDCDESYSAPYGKYIDTKTDKSQKWSGMTLDILASGWGADGDTTGIWSQPELYVNSASQTGNLGATVNSAVWSRQEAIKEIYGVTTVWHRSISNSSMQNELQTGLEAGAAKFHIATPRGYEAQSLIAADTVYDLANSKYIDLTKPYYNQSAVDSYSVYGHTFFVGGDFSYLDEYTSYVVFYNQALSEKQQTFGNLYNMVRNGKWTISMLAKKSALVGADDNGEAGYQDTDTYGYGTSSMTSFFQSSGIKQVSVDKSSGDPSQYNYQITLNDPNVSELVTSLANIKSSTWARTSWDGGYGAMFTSFTGGRLLFYDEVVEKIFEFPEQSETFKVGILPKPMLNEDQGQYYTPFAAQATVMCIPKATLDREMSEYFFDVLSWTGQEHVMNAFYEEIKSRLYDDGESSREDSYEMLTDYALSGIIYDLGYIATGYGGRFMTHVQSETISQATASSSPFMTLYSEAYNDANKILNNSETGWNTKAKNYKE